MVADNLPVVHREELEASFLPPEDSLFSVDVTATNETLQNETELGNNSRAFTEGSGMLPPNR
jgi:hypothetical protein